MRTEAQDAARAMEVVPLRHISFYDRHRANGIDKAGTVPFIVRDDGIYFYLHKPIGRHPELGDPGFQIPKGTREAQNDDGEWERFNAKKHSKEKKEPLIVSALREGIEEVGLKTANIERLMEWGAVTFTSAAKGHEKSMWLYLAEVRNQEDFAPPDEEHGNTAQCKWFSLETAEAEEQIRPDHRVILRNLDQKLKEYLNSTQHRER